MCVGGGGEGLDSLLAMALDICAAGGEHLMVRDGGETSAHSSWYYKEQVSCLAHSPSLLLKRLV